MFRLARFSLANRALVALITLVIAAAGVISVTQLKQELIPAIEFPQVSVLTVVPGASPEIVDEQVSLPISQALGSVANTEKVVADSSSGLSMVSLSFAYGIDSDEYIASVKAALESLQGTLPTDSDPQVIAGSTADIPIMSLTASSSGDTGTAELSTLLRDSIVPRLEAVEDVRAVTVSGAETQRVQITPDLVALATYGIGPQDIGSALEANGMTLPVGSITENGILVPVQGGEAITTIDALKTIPLASTTEPGVVVQLGEIAAVDVVTEAPTSITRMNGDPAVSLSITGVQGADVVGVSHAITAVLDELTEEYGDTLTLTTVFDQAPFIEESIQHLAIEGLLGLLFAIIVILVFLLSVRSTIVTAISIPISVLVTFIGLNLGGYSLNMLTLGALTIAIGRVVDDSIVVIENIKRHLEYGEPKVQAILTAVREVAGAITASTLTTVAVFLPIALVGGQVGELFSPFALTVTIAMLSSLFVALTIVPVLSYWFLKQPKNVIDPEATRVAAEEKEQRGLLQRVYRPVLRGTQKHPVITLVSAALLLVITVSLVPLLKVDFLGSAGQNSLSLSQKFAPGTDLETISAGATQVEDALLEVDGVESVMVTAGSSGGGFAALLGGSGGTASFTVITDKAADQTQVKDDVRAAVEPIKDAGTITLVEGGGFGSSTVDVIVTAANEAELATSADEVFSALDGIEYATEVVSDRAPAQSILQITVDRQAALEQGLTEIQVLGIVAGTLSPQSIGEITLDGEALKIFVDTGATPATADEIAAISLPTATGLVPLSSLATVAPETVATSISRQAGDLVATISLTPEEGQLGGLSAGVQTALDELELPAGSTATIGGLASQQTESFGQLGLAMVAAIAIVFLLLVGTFRSLLQPLILLVSIPFAATGAIGLLLITGKPLGISALIGMLMLIGIVVTNAIVLIDLVNQYRKRGQSVKDAVYNGARQRLRPILMTALATIFALIPMALGVTGSSGFISQDLAIVVIGGLVSSTALTLILVPVLYRLVEGGRERRGRHSARARDDEQQFALEAARV